jgi:putative DNA primase/helicase
MTWATRTVEDSTFDRVIELMNDGLSQKDVAIELNINKSTVSRSVKKAEALGMIKIKNRAPRQTANGNTDGWHEPAGGGP